MVGHNARDLRDEIFGNRIGDGWQPPGYRITGSGKWPDWMSFPIPLLSSGGTAVIGAEIASSCEFLPWIREPRHEYFLINVLAKIPRGNWSCKESTAFGGVLASADIISLNGVDIPPIFTLEGFSRRIFVSDSVARSSESAGLTGAVFVDPRVKRIHVSFIQGVKKIFKGFIRLEDDF